MTLDSFLSQLNGVQPRGTRHVATCPAHADTNPSLQITTGDKGILLKCWSGCTLPEICAALNIEQRDLFFDVLDTSPQRRKAAALERDRQRHARKRHAEQQGTLIDALREADFFVRSRRGIDISTWSHERLDRELDALASAYRLLESEALHG